MFRVLLVAVTLGLTGCYFAHGLKVAPEAYARIDPKNSNRLIIVLRAEQWHTGNAHVPFDFTVYKYNRWYEVRIPRKKGDINLKEVELFACGRRIDEVLGSLVISEDHLKIDLQYSISPTGRITEQVSADVKLVAGLAPPSSCS
jgi:hypothetical protein